MRSPYRLASVLLLLLSTHAPLGLHSSAYSAPEWEGTSSPASTHGRPAGDTAPVLGYEIYEDALAGGWTNWSWASTVDFSHPARAVNRARASTGRANAGGPTSRARVIAWRANAGWSGLYLHRDGGLDTAGYTSLSLVLQASQPVCSIFWSGL